VIIGLDLDNTIVCYDESLHRLAVELFEMPATVRAEKNAIRQYFRDQGRERDWTALQGVAYGSRMSLAKPFPGALSFMEQAIGSGHAVSIVSHRTRRPVIGDSVDLHEVAVRWLEENGFLAARSLDSSRVFFEETREAKVQRVRSVDCEVFLDDLPEVLEDASFPQGVLRYLFAPTQTARVSGDWSVVGSWAEFGRMVL